MSPSPRDPQATARQPLTACSEQSPASFTHYWFTYAVNEWALQDEDLEHPKEVNRASDSGVKKKKKFKEQKRILEKNLTESLKIQQEILENFSDSSKFPFKT